MEQGSAPPYVAEPYVEEDGGSPQEQASENLPDDPALDEDGNFNYESSYGTDNVTRVGKFLRKAAKSKVLAVATGGMSKLGSKEGRKQLGTIAKNVALMPLLAPLLPFAPAMKKQLKKQGLSVPKNPLDLYKLFYKEVVQKHKKNSFGDDYEDFDFNLEDDNIIDDIISGLIKGIVSFFKKSKEKKDGGEKLTDAEKLAADANEKVTKTLKDKAQEGAEGAIGKTVLSAAMNKKTWLIIGGVVVVIIIIVVMRARAKK
jgi:hypothetical protein